MGFLAARKSAGFTLIEIMIVVAVLAILSAIALPRYKTMVVNGNRATVQGDLQGAAAGMAAYRAQNFSYTGATLTGAGGVLPNPSSSGYTLALSIDTAGQSFEIKATPIAGKTQVGNGALIINQAGERCWNKADDTTCTLGATGQEWK